MRRLPIQLLRPVFALVICCIALTSFSSSAHSANASESAARIDVVEVNGLIDPVQAEWIRTSIADAQTDNSIALILQIDSSASLVSNSELDSLASAVTASRVPVIAWVGPGKASAQGGVLKIVAATDAYGVAAGGHLGDLGATNAEELDAPILGELYVGLNGKTYRGVTLNTSSGVAGNNQPIVSPRFLKMPLWDRLFHTVASAPVAYLLFLIGLCLIMFEFVSAGVGVAAFVGLICFALGCYGFGVLPVRPVSLGLLVVALLAFAVDVQAGVPRFWTAVGTVTLVVGSIWLYSGSESLSWIALSVGIGGVLLTMLTGMPSIQRVRFSTPTIGREWMIGTMGVASQSISPEGIVEVGGARWRARTNRATPIADGAAVRVVAIDGLILEVEPETGGAKDHRERAKPAE